MIRSPVGDCIIALETVRPWLFVPATHAGVPVATLAQAPITFSIY